jgi:HK97 family phage portal protein
VVTLRTLLGTPDPGQKHDISIADAESMAVAGWIDLNDTGLPPVSEAKALTIPAYSRGESLIAGTIAGLPLKAYRKNPDGTREYVPSVLDQPQGPASMSQFQWVERLVTHLVRYSEAYPKRIENGAGALEGIELVLPASVTKVEQAGWGKRYTIKMEDGQEKTFTDPEVVQILGMHQIGLRGTPIYQWSKPLFQVALAARTASGRVFTGPMISGLVTPAAEEEIERDEMETILLDLNARISGASKAGQIAAINRHLEIHPWQQTNDEAQFDETLTSVTEAFARLLGLPPHLLAAIDKQTSWGTGIAEQNIGLARYCLMAYTSRIESALVAFLPADTYAEFDYKGLLQGSPQQEIELLLAQTGQQAILTVDEARAIQNRGPMPVVAAPPPAGETDAE